MIYGVGIDILEVSRLETLRGRYDDPFFTKTYTGAERAAAMERADPIVWFAGRFAVKEAVFKALGVSSAAFRWSDIETLNDAAGRPYVVLRGEAKRAADEAGVRRVFVSLSNDGGFVAAFAVAEI